MDYDLAGRDDVQILKYWLKYSYQDNVPIQYAYFTDPTTGQPMQYANGITTNAYTVPMEVKEKAPFKLYKSRNGRRLTFYSEIPFGIYGGGGKRYKLTHPTTPRQNIAVEHQNSISDTLVFSLTRKKLKVFVVESVYGYATDLTAAPGLLTSFLSNAYIYMYPKMDQNAGNMMLSIIAKELLTMALRQGMDVDYLLHSYRLMSTPDHVLQHLTSPFLMSYRQEHVLFHNAHLSPKLVTYNSIKGAIKSTFGRCNSTLLREVGKHLKGYMDAREISNVSVPNVGTASVTAVSSTSYTYSLGYGNTGYYTNRSQVLIDLNALDVIKSAPHIFQTLDYQDKYIAFFLNSGVYTPYSGVGYNSINLQSIGLISMFQDNKKWRLLTEDSDSGLPPQGLEQAHAPFMSPWKNLNLLKDTYDQLTAYPPDKVPPKIKDKYPAGLQLPERWETIKDLHDKVSRDYNIIKAEVNNRDIEFDEYISLLDGTTVLDTELVLPKNTSQLVEWGRKLNNCIASYGDKVIRGDTYVFALYKNGEPFINGEISPTDHGIIQLRIDRNKEAPPEYRARVKMIWDDIGKLMGLDGYFLKVLLPGELNAPGIYHIPNVVVDNVAGV